MKIKEIIRKNVVSVSKNEEIGVALDIMKDRNINGLPVVEDSGEILGMIVKSDIYRALIGPGRFKSCPVEWAMTKDVITANVDDDLLVVAKRLRENDIIALPIVEGKKVVGIISIEDIVDFLIEK